ncbi:hypothetical protein FOZ62_000581, partial [Perkinsus olseni]
KTEASQPAPAACERQNKNVEEKSSGVVPVDATAPAAPSEKVEVDGMAHERDSEAEVEDKVANKLNTELKELLMEARRSEERYDCIKLEIDTLRDLNRSRSGLIDEAKKLVHALREELLDKEISLRQNEKEQLELDLRLIDDDARFIEEELTRLQTRAEKAQAEADAKFIRDELAKLKAGEEDVEDEEDVSGEDEEYEESSSEADEDEEEEEESYEFEEDDGSSGLDDNSEVAVRKNREQFFEMMMELEQLKMEAQAADQLDKLADALKKDESKRLKAFEDKLKHREEHQNENDKAREKDIWYFLLSSATMMFSCESLILLLTGILVEAELEVTNPRGYDIEDTGYCMVDAGSKGTAVFELEEVVQPVPISRVALGEIPSPKVKKPASVDITVEAVIETRHAAADGDVGTVARPEPMGITGATGDPPSPVGDGVLAEEVASQGEFEPERKRVNPWKPAVRLVHL